MTPPPKEIDYRKAFYDLVMWVKLEIHQKPQQLMQAENTTLQELHMAQGMTSAYNGVLLQATALLQSQAKPEEDTPESEETDG